MLISLVSCSLPSFALFSLCDEALWITGDEPNMLEFEYNIQYNNTIQYRYSKLLPTYLDWYISSQRVGDDRHSNCRILKCQRSQTITSLLWRSTSKSGSNIWINVFYYLLIRWLYLCLWNEKNVLIVLSNVFFCWRSKPNDIHFTIMFDPKSRKFSPLDVWFFFFPSRKYWNKFTAEIKKKCYHVCTWWTLSNQSWWRPKQNQKEAEYCTFVRWLRPWLQINAYSAACLGGIWKYPVFARMFTYDLLCCFFVTNLLCFSSRLFWIIAAIQCPGDNCVNASPSALLLIIKVHQLYSKVASMATKSYSHHPFCFIIHPQSSQKGHPLGETY